MSLEDILALTANMEDKELQKKLVEQAKLLNQERGKALSDLGDYKTQVGDKDKELADLQNQNSTYTELMKKMSDLNIDVKNADKLAEQLQIKKTAADEVAQLKTLVTNLDKENKNLKSEKEVGQLKSALDAKLNDALTSYKDKDGNEYKIADRFINKDDLYKPVDTSNDVLVNDRLTTVLNNAHQEQEDFMKETGFRPSTQIHDVNQTSSSGHFGGNPGIDQSKVIQQVAENNGSIDSVALGLAMLDSANK